MKEYVNLNQNMPVHTPLALSRASGVIHGIFREKSHITLRR